MYLLKHSLVTSVVLVWMLRFRDPSNKSKAVLAEALELTSGDLCVHFLQSE